MIENKYEEITIPELSLKYDFLVEYRGEKEYIIIPEGIRVLEFNALSHDSKLRGVILPKSLQYIKDEAFSYCYKLEEIHIPETVIELGNFVFSNCKNLKKVTYSPEHTKIGKNCFAHCQYLDENGQTLPVIEKKHIQKENDFYERLEEMSLEEIEENPEELIIYYHCHEKKLLAQKDRESYMKLLQLGLDNNIAYFQFVMASHYMDGDIVEKDHEKYLYWLEKAVEQGFAAAYYLKYLAIRFREYDSKEDWHQVLEEGAFLGSQLCQKGMFHHLSNGDYCLPQPKAAVFWLKQAIYNSYGEDKRKYLGILGDCYLDGFGVVRDIQRALDLVCLSLEEGENPEEDYLVKECYKKAEKFHITLKKPTFKKLNF